MPIYPILAGALALTCIYLLFLLYRRHRRASLRNRLYELLLQRVDAYILLIDRDFNVLKTNYYDLTGTSVRTKPVKVGNLLRCKNGEDAGTCGLHALCADCPVRSAIDSAYAAKDGFSGLEAPMTLYTGEGNSGTVVCDISVSGNYLSLRGEEHMLLTVLDITKQKQAHRELTEARLRAEESDRMKSAFLANTSHELRTPLNAIVGFSELLISDTDEQMRAEYAQIIRSNNELLLQLVNDILDLSKIEAGTLEFTYSEVNLNTMMEELEGVYRMKNADSPVRILFRPALPVCRIRTDRKRLSQVVSNFLSNAVKFTTEGEIVFGYEIGGGEIRFYVTDTGTGIPDEKVGKVFLRFVKLNTRQSGSGIGLAICKSIVEAMGGRIGVESQYGKGSTFWFSLPVQPLD